MASANDCLRAIDAAAMGALSDDQLKEIIETLNRIREGRRAAEGLESLEGELFDAAGRIAEDVELAAQIEKRNRLKNIIVRGRVLDLANRARQEFGDASLALEAITVGINTPLEGGRKSVDSIGNGILRRNLGGMIAELRQENLHGVFARGDLDREVAKELWDLSLESPTGRATQNSDAKKIARIVHKYRKAAVLRENRAGAYIRFRQGYITRQTHDRARMERAGFDAWRAEVAHRMDWDRMEVPVNEREKFLRSAYEALVTGVRKHNGGDENDLLFAFKGPGNLAKKESASRVLLFKSADDWFDYNEKFGRRDLREAVLDDFRRSAMNTALMENLGTNPEFMFKKLRDDLKEKYRSDPKQVRRLDRRSLDWFMAEVDGSVNFANNHTIAAVGRTVRALQSMAKLGGAWISAWADLAFSSGERRFQGRSLMDSWLDAFRAPIEGLSGDDARKYGELVGVGIDGQLGDFVARFSAQDDAPGRTSKMLSMFFKLNLLGPWTDATKRGIGLMISRDLAMHAERGFDALPENMRRLLGQYGLDGKKWEIARRAVADTPKGKMMFPSEVENVSGDVFRGLSKAKQRRLKDEVTESLSAFITDRVEFAAPTPGARERAFLRMGYQPGTPAGEAIRFLMQFKSFPITVITRVQGREVFGRSRGSQTVLDAFAKGEADLVGLANVIAGGTVLGFFSLQAKELAKGREFRESNPETFIAAALQGGGLGIYGDFLLGEANRFGGTPLDTAVGPTVDTILGRGGVVDIAQRAIHSGARGEPPDIGASLLKLAQSNLPFANLFYTKTAMDYLILYQLQEMTNPGYLRRVERRIKREQNQEFFIPPSRVIPRGGGDRLFEGVR